MSEEANTEKQVKASPTPWEVDDSKGPEMIRVISAPKENGKRAIVCVFPMMEDAAIKRANAELIVAAANSHSKAA
jgi:hypothetical protein